MSVVPRPHPSFMSVVQDASSNDPGRLVQCEQKWWTGRGGWYTQVVKNTMAVSLISLNMATSLILSVNGPLEQSSYLVGPPCSVQGITVIWENFVVKIFS